MKKEEVSLLMSLTLVGLIALSSPAVAQQYAQHRSDVQVDVGAFYDGLAPYGDWVEMPDYGWSWSPRVNQGWRPYTRGQWIMTDDGWFWDSDEEFGWAAYHYGRWVNDRYYGWVWVPGTEWAPAWVSWRHGNGYTGWAPLPPRATWRTHVGLEIGGLEIDGFLGSDDYAFVPDRAFVDRGVYQQVLPPTQNITIINVTNNVTNYTVVNQRVVNGGIAVANIERAAGRHVPRTRTVDVDRSDAPRGTKAGEVVVYRPAVRAAPQRRPAEGKSLVRGDEAPVRLVERRQEREQERQQKGNAPDVTAKDASQKRPVGHPAHKEQNAVDQPAAQHPDERAQQQEAQHQQQVEQQRLDREKVQAAEQQQRDHAQQGAAKQRAIDQEQRKVDAQAPSDKHAQDAQQASEQKQSDQAQHQQQAKDNAKGKGNPKDTAKGKKNPKASPTPPPAE